MSMKKATTKPEYYIGLLSGTSIDSIDTGIFEITPNSVNLINALNYEIDNKTKNDLHNIISRQSVKLSELGNLNRRLGELFYQSVQEILAKTNIDKNQIKAIGLHGQTLFHYPEQSNGFTMQIGDPNTIAEKTQIPVITDFRQRDIVNNGQGAPLAPLFHQKFFRDALKTRAIINIGGITNITILDSQELLDTAEQVNYISSDLGPGNTLIDQWFRIHNEKSNYQYDYNGEFAKTGKINQDLLADLLLDNYFKKAWPKSTGREYFNLEWLNLYLKKHNKIPPEDIQATLTELTATIIANTIKAYKHKIDEVYLCGGGAYNQFLLSRIKLLLPTTKIEITEQLGLSANWVESATFAWLAYCTWHKQKHQLSNITGSQAKDTLLGCIYF